MNCELALFVRYVNLNILGNTHYNILIRWSGYLQNQSIQKCH